MKKLIPLWFPKSMQIEIDELLASPEGSLSKYELVKLRLVRDERMEKVWSRFSKITKNRDAKVESFFNEVPLLYTSLEKRKTPEQRRKIKSLEKSLQSQSIKMERKIQEIISLIEPNQDQHRHTIDQFKKIKLSLQKILTAQQFDLHPYTFIGHEDVGPKRKRQSVDSHDIYMTEAITAKFRKIFNQPYPRLVGVVSYVLQGVETPANQTLDQLRDKVRKRSKK